jgi:hypothetical protein
MDNDELAIFDLLFSTTSDDLPFPVRFFAAGFDADNLRFERLAEQSIDQPVDYQRSRARVTN